MVTKLRGQERKKREGYLAVKRSDQVALIASPALLSPSVSWPK